MRSWKRLAGVLLILAVALTTCAAPDSGGPVGVNQGNQARDFALESLAGAEVSLADHAGKVVLVNFWATWCPPCMAEIPELQEAYETYQDEELVVLGINVEEPREIVEPFVQSMGMTYPVLLDENGQVMEMYRALGLPMSLIVDRQGVIQVRHVGYLSAEQLERYLEGVFP